MLTFHNNVFVTLMDTLNPQKFLFVGKLVGGIGFSLDVVPKRIHSLTYMSKGEINCPQMIIY